MTNLIPESHATTSYELCQDTIAALRAEPKRFNWGVWKAKVINRNLYMLLDDVERIRQRGSSAREPMIRAMDPELMPACQTIGCLAGWMVTLKRFDLDTSKHFDEIVLTIFREFFPQNIDLLIDLRQLFIPKNTLGFIMTERRDDESQEAYVDRAVLAMGIFMRKWAIQLQLHTLKPRNVE